MSKRWMGIPAGHYEMLRYWSLSWQEGYQTLFPITHIEFNHSLNLMIRIQNSILSTLQNGVN